MDEADKLNEIIECAIELVRELDGVDDLGKQAQGLVNNLKEAIAAVSGTVVLQATRLLIDNIDAGRLLSMPSARVTRLAKQGTIPCVLLPDGEFRYMKRDLRDWVEKHRRPASDTED